MSSPSLDCGKEAPARLRDARLVPQKKWLAKVKSIETRWQMHKRRRPRSNERKQTNNGIFRAELSSIGRVTDMRVVDSDDHPTSMFAPGEPIRVELELETSAANTEIGARIEAHTRDTLLFASKLPMVFHADNAGTYMFSFPLEPWLMGQETDKAGFKMAARIFFRRENAAWEEMNVASVRFCIRGEIRERFLIRNGVIGEGDPAIPMWLDAVSPKPPAEMLERKPLLRPRLDWRLYRLEEATDETSQEGAQEATEIPKGATL